jgi:mRNA interferase MazF
MGEVWWCEPPEIGRRPVVVLSRDKAISAHRVAIVAPCSTTFRGLPSEVALDSGESVTIGVFVERIGTLSAHRMRELCAALAVAVDC